MPTPSTTEKVVVWSVNLFVAFIVPLAFLINTLVAIKYYFLVKNHRSKKSIHRFYTRGVLVCTIVTLLCFFSIALVISNNAKEIPQRLVFDGKPVPTNTKIFIWILWVIWVIFSIMYHLVGRNSKGWSVMAVFLNVFSTCYWGYTTGYKTLVSLPELEVQKN